MHRPLEIVLFDMAMFHLLREMWVGSIDFIGKQRAWVKYYRRYYLFREPVAGVRLFNAVWRSACDRSQQRSSNNISESWFDKVNDMVYY